MNIFTTFTITIIPAFAPTSPGTPSATANYANNMIVVTWAAPTSSKGSSPITYTVQFSTGV